MNIDVAFLKVIHDASREVIRCGIAKVNDKVRIQIQQAYQVVILLHFLIFLLFFFVISLLFCFLFIDVGYISGSHAVTLQ